MKNLTDYFQSLELVQAGVPKESSDYFFYGDKIISKERINPSQFPCVPCWSFGALWDFVHEKGGDYEFGTDMSSEEVISTLVSAAKKIGKHEGAQD